MRRKPVVKLLKKPSTAAGLAYLDRRPQPNGEVYLYYRRAGKRIPLPQPEGSDAFHVAYQAAAVRFAPKTVQQAQTVAAAITAYLASADFAQLAEASQRDYRYYFRTFSADFGALPMDALDAPWLENLRDTYARQPNQWNATRARMIAVTDKFMSRSPGVLPANPWRLCKRLKVAQSDANKPWPRDVLERVFAAASPQFRALLTAYLLTAQRGSDVTAFSAAQYDREAQTITLRQVKTKKAMTLHVPAALAEVFELSEKPGQLLHTPRGKPWTLDNAQQTLAALLKRLKLPRYTLHGLRSTGPSALRREGWANPALRPLTGHDSDSNLEVYLRHADTAPLTKHAQEALADLFSELTSAKRLQNSQTDLESL